MAMNAGKTRNKPGTDFRGETPIVPWGGGMLVLSSLMVPWSRMSLSLGLDESAPSVSERAEKVWW